MGIKSTLRHALERVESGFDMAFGAKWNPFYFLGGLGWYFYWIVAVSGIYVYIFFDSGIKQAYNSVEYMTHVQWYAAGIMRSLHRYASDALVVVVILHLLREWIKDRYWDARKFAWITGVLMLWLVYGSGISGYWIVWDKLAQYVAIATSEWLDALPIFGEPIARNFLHESVISDRFFTLMVFIHIAVPLILLFVMWIHIQRHMYPRVNPPRGLLIGSSIMMLGLSILYPALSQGPANLNEVPTEVGLDWFYLPLYPLLDRFSGLTLWGVVVGATLILFMLPWLTRKRKPAAAVVDLENCNGCGRCVEDCPYSAVDLLPRTDGKPYSHQVVVNPKKCVACGICAGACPTATPYRRRSQLVAGIDLPDITISKLRDDSISASEALQGESRVLVYGCQHGPSLQPLQQQDVGTMSLPCIGYLPPAFIDFLLSRQHVDGVFLTGCRDCDCQYRLGEQWTSQRINRERDPQLRQRVPDERIATFWAGIDHDKQLAEQVEAFRQRLQQLQDGHTVPSESSQRQRAKAA